MERTFNVWRYNNGVKSFVGLVRATNHTLADRKATTLFGPHTWTTEKDNHETRPLV